MRGSLSIKRTRADMPVRYALGLFLIVLAGCVPGCLDRERRPFVPSSSIAALTTQPTGAVLVVGAEKALLDEEPRRFLLELSGNRTSVEDAEIVPPDGMGLISSMAREDTGDAFFITHANVSTPGSELVLGKYDLQFDRIWQVQWDGADFLRKPELCPDHEGGVVVLGRASVPADLDPGPGVISVDNQDLPWVHFVSRFDANGNQAWVHWWPAAIADVDAGHDNSVLAAGFTFGKSIPGLPESEGLSWEDVSFVMKLKADGSTDWIQAVPGSESEKCFGNIYVAAKADGSYYAAGVMIPLNVHRMPEDDESKIDTGRSFITLFNSSGWPLWTVSWPKGEAQVSYIQAVDDGSVLVYGSCAPERPTWFQSVAPDPSWNAPRDNFIARIDPQGIVLWSRAWKSGTGATANTQTCYDNEHRRLSLAGRYVRQTHEKIIDLDPGPRQLCPFGYGSYVSCFNLDGGLEWIWVKEPSSD